MSTTQKQIRDNAAYATFEQADKVITALRAEVEQFNFLLVANNAVDARDLGGAIDSYHAEVTALQQAVNEARRLLIDITDVFGHDSSIDAWLAAHSAPEVTP